MYANELIERLQNLVSEVGNVKVKTFDLDRDVCDITEIEYDGLDDEHIYIG